MEIQHFREAVSVVLQLEILSKHISGLHTAFWPRIAADASNPRKLWNSLSALLGRREQTKSTAPSSFTAADYLLFIEEKVDAVRRDTEGSQPPTFDPVDFLFFRSSNARWRICH